MMTTPPARQRLLLKALVDGDVRFVIIGGHAVSAHGYERATRDIDIVFSAEIGNCKRLSAVLSGLDASVAVADMPAPGGMISGEWLAAGTHFVFSTEHGLLDALTWIAGFDYQILESRAHTADLAEGLSVRVCSFEDLVRMKELADRPRDREDLRELRSVRGEP